MQISNYSFKDLPFSTLFKTYVQNFDQLKNFYEINPFDNDSIRQKAGDYQFAGDREHTVQILTDLNKKFNVDRAALNNINRLKADDSLVIVTGQQLGLYGGPLYTILKTVSTIQLARKYERLLDQPVIPVFWLADEDHDYDEVRSLHLLDNEEVTEFALPPKKNGLPTVAELPLPDALNTLRTEIKEVLYNTDFSKDLWSLIDDAFQPDRTFYESFGNFISSLFSKHGLVLAGSNNADVKEMTRNYLKESIAKADQIRAALEVQSQKVGQEYHQQVTLYDSNLFYFDEEAGRTKISRNGTGWKTESGVEWQTDELINKIDRQPEQFSPNVFLRPILQDGLLPSLGYVAGPGETAYYAQMKEMYSCFDLEMPVIFPRMSATLIEPAINRIIDELPFEFHEYSNRIEDLESDFVAQTDRCDIEAIFDEWKQKVEDLAAPKKEKIAQVDPTLDGAAGKATAVYFGELDKLKGKLYRAVKQQEQTQLKRIRRIKANLFPGDDLQERVIAAIFFMNKYGVDIWDTLLETLDEDDEFDQHKLIYL